MQEEDQEAEKEAEEEMSDRDNLCALLDKWGVPWARCENDIDVGGEYGQNRSEKVTGYLGFYTLFEFTEDGEFVKMGAWE